MFILYAIPLGLIAGRLGGGSLEALGSLPFRLAPLAVAGLLAQVVLFSTPVGNLAPDAVPALYIATTALVLGVVWINRQVPGLWLVLIGATLNLAAIVANGGYMPADPAALAAAGLSATDGPTNSVVATNPALAPLTDVFALPDWVPFANVFSLGDALIGAGVAVAIARGMQRTPRPIAGASTPPEPGVVQGGTSPH